MLNMITGREIVNLEVEVERDIEAMEEGGRKPVVSLAPDAKGRRPLSAVMSDDHTYVVLPTVDLVRFPNLVSRANKIASLPPDRTPPERP